MRDLRKSLISIRAIAFDFDGVLIESVEIKTRAYALLFKEEGYEPVRQIMDFHLKNGGMSRFEKIRKVYNDILHRPLSESHHHELCARFSNLVVEEVVAAPWVNGAKEFLTQNNKRYTFAVISGTPEEELKEIVRRRKMEHFFDSVRGSPMNKVILLRELMEKYQLKSTELVFVGDSETDWRAAQATGVPFILRYAKGGVANTIDYKGPQLPCLSELNKILQKPLFLHDH